ncbi:hypothetical protein [Polaromonas sp. CG9_12]|nr:hypothetical protein [Polaromonas sp. CG9_12]
MKKAKNGKWICYGCGSRVIQQATAQIAYLKWMVKQMHLLSDEVQALSDEKTQLQEDLVVMANKAESVFAQHRCELEKLSGDNNRWVVERINHYNQQCIDWIWRFKTLPSLSQYQEWTGRK